MHIRVRTVRSMTGSYTALCVPLACAAVILAELGIDKLECTWTSSAVRCGYRPFPCLASWRVRCTHRVRTAQSMPGSYTALCVPQACVAVTLLEPGIDKLECTWTMLMLCCLVYILGLLTGRFMIGDSVRCNVKNASCDWQAQVHHCCTYCCLPVSRHCVRAAGLGTRRSSLRLSAAPRSTDGHHG